LLNSRVKAIDLDSVALKIPTGAALGGACNPPASGRGFRRSHARLLAGVVAIVALCASAIVFAPVASAADPTATQYCDGLTGGTTTTGTACGEQGTAGQSQSGGSASPGSAPAASSAGGLGGQVGQLPFTGWDLLSLAAIAVALTTSGIALARVTRRGTGS
jgi:hypothetical protein